MATPVPKIAEGLHTLLMCPIHLDILNRPKTLPCQHVVCEECIGKWIEARAGDLYCPECHIAQPLPPGGARALPNNFKIASLCEFVESLMSQQDKPEAAACDEHLKKPVNMICLHCTVPVCEECLQFNHKSHKTVSIEEFLKVTGNPLPKLVGQAKNKLKDIFSAVEVIEKTRKELKDNHALVKRESNDRVHKLMKMLTQAQVKLNGELETKYYEKDAVLTAQLEALSTARAEISELLQLQQLPDEESSMTKSVLTASGQQLWNQLTQLTQQNLQLAPQENSVMSIQWDKELESSLRREVLGTVMTKAVPSCHQTTLSLSISRVFVQSPVKIQVALRDAVGSPVEVTDLSTLSASISAPGGFTGLTQLTPGEGGVAETQFTPKSIGKYKIDVQLFGSPIKNSPLSFIAKPRGELKFDKKQSFNQPHDIIEHDDNFFITNKASNQVIITDKQLNLVGKFLPPSDPGLQRFEPYSIAYTGRTFVVTDVKHHCVFEFTNSTYLQRFGQDVLSQPTGIACDNKGKVYVADGQKHCIFVFDQVREHIAVLARPGSTRGQLKSPWFIAINSRGEVVVADFGNHRIQVIDPTKDEVTRLIDVHLDQKVWDVRGLAVDRNDNIFVTVRQAGNMRGWSTETVVVYNPDGVQLGRFGDGFNYVRGLTITESEGHTMALIVDGANHRIRGYLM